MFGFYARVTVTARGARLKGIICENCGRDFAYLFQCEVSARDEARAWERLNRTLQFEDDIAPCPYCQHVQVNMRRSRALLRPTRIPWYAIVLGLVLAGGIVSPVFGEAGVGVGMLCLGAFMLIHKYGVYRLDYASPRRSKRGERESPPCIWTREELEGLAAHDASLDISDALLDWESRRV